MTKKRKFQILIGLLAIMVGGILALTLWIANAKKSVTIYDFARTIQYDEKSNYALTLNDVVEAQILAADVKEEYITDPQEIIGKYITGTAYKGQHIMKHQLQSDPTYVEVSGISELADYRKFYLPIGYANAFAGDIEAGDTVDLLWAENGGGLSTDRTDGVTGSENGINYNQARIVMSNIPIYQIYTADGSVYNKKTTDPETLNKFKGQDAATLQGEDGEQPTGAPAYVALTVTVEQYEELYVRNQTGTLSMVSRFKESQDVESDGYLVIKDGLANVYTGKGNLEFEHGVDAQNQDKKDVEPVVTAARPDVYTFLRRLAVMDKTPEQEETYKTLYAQFVEYAQAVAGTEWEINSPEQISMVQLEAAVSAMGQEKMLDYQAWKTNVQELTTSVYGAPQIMPWES